MILVRRHDRGDEDAREETHAAEMPRTMLRYAIERVPPERRARLMAS